jgi:O-antigen ligase
MKSLSHALSKAWSELVRVQGPVASIALAGLCVALPLAPTLVPLFLMVTLLGLVIQHRSVMRWPGSIPWSTPWPWMIAYYLLHLLGMLWTSDQGFGWFDLQIKAPLLVLPVLALLMPKEVRVGRDAVLLLAVVANAFAAIVCIVSAVVRIALGAEASIAEEIFSARFSYFIHPSYFALYLTLSLAAWLLTPLHRTVSGGMGKVLLLLLVAGVVLCGSKMGWILMLVLLLAALIVQWKDREVRLSVAGLLLASAIGLVGLVSASPYARERVVEAWHAAFVAEVDPLAETSSAARRITWSAAGTLIDDHPLAGTGTGDIKNELVRLYTERGQLWAAEHRLNAHSQFLQSAACLGLSGLALLMLMVIIPLLGAIRCKDALLSTFLLLCAINWSVESMLEVQAGVVHFALFSMILYWTASAPEDRPLRRPNEPRP